MMEKFAMEKFATIMRVMFEKDNAAELTNDIMMILNRIDDVLIDFESEFGQV